MHKKYGKGKQKIEKVRLSEEWDTERGRESKNKSESERGFEKEKQKETNVIGNVRFSDEEKIKEKDKEKSEIWENKMRKKS